MTAPVTDQATTPPVRSSVPPAVPGNRSARRHGAAARQVGAAGQTRRTLQRDLARREASLRISRRVSGPAGGVSRPPLADASAVAPAPPAPFMPAPAAPAPEARPQRPSTRAVTGGADLRVAPVELDIPGFVGSTKPRRVARPAAPAPQRAPQALQVTAPAPATPPRATAFAASAPLTRARPLASAASAVAAAPVRLPISLPQRPRLTALPALPSGLVESGSGRRRVSTPAIMVAAVTMVILTFGAILGLQISKTQVNARMGADLSAISTLQQKVTATREQLNRASASANVDGAARKGGLIEPDLTDVTFRRVGNRSESAERAKRLLSKAPVAPTAAQRVAAEAKAKAAATAAATSETMAPVNSATSAGASVPPAADFPTQAATGTGAIQ